MSLLRRIAKLFRRSKLDQEIEAELRAQIEMRIADNIAAGMWPRAKIDLRAGRSRAHPRNQELLVEIVPKLRTA